MKSRASLITMIAVYTFAIWASLATGRAEQASPAPVPDPQTLGPRIGERVPDFTLTDQQGRSHALTSLMGPKGLMLVFFRSADW